METTEIKTLESTQASSDPATTSPRSNIIVRLVSKNFKRIKALEILPNGSAAVTLKGKNGAGKSSVLDVIAAILRGTICERPIREGAGKSESIIEFGDFEATLRITEGGSSLRVKSKTGAEITGPRTFLKDHSNEILLDSTGFMRLGETAHGRRQQAEKLRQLVGLDFSALDAEKQQKYDERTLVNRELDTARKKLVSYTRHDGVPAEEVSVKTLQERLNEVQSDGDKKLIEARKHNEANAKVKAFWTESKDALQTTDMNVTAIRGQVVALEEQLVKAKADLVAIELKRTEQLDILVEREKQVSTLVYQDEDAVRFEIIEARKPFQQQILDADDTNQKVRANKRHAELTQEVATKLAQSEALTARINDIEESKQSHLAAAKFPLPGLSFDETGILLNGLPLNQGSQAQQVKAVVAIGFAFKPRIPVVLVKDASILDEDSLKEMSAMAEANSGQVWLETITSDDPSAIEIVDGGIAE